MNCRELVGKAIKPLVHRSADPGSHQQPPRKTLEATVCTNNPGVGEAGTR